MNIRFELHIAYLVLQAGLATNVSVTRGALLDRAPGLVDADVVRVLHGLGFALDGDGRNRRIRSMSRTRVAGIAASVKRAALDISQRLGYTGANSRS